MVQEAGTNLLLTWPTSATGFSLQWSTNLANPNWSNASPQPVVVGGAYTVTNSPTNQFRFYRLKK